MADSPGARSRPLIPLWLALVAALVGGAVLDAAFPDIGWWPLAFVGVAFSLVGLVGRSVGGAVAVGAVFGASFYFIHISWITRYLGPLPWFGLAGIETLFMALGSIPIALAYRWLPRVAPGWWGRFVALPALVAGLWTARELFMGSWPYTGFPWGRIGMSQSESPLAHIASWTGVSGLTFLMVFVAAAGIEWGRAGRWRELRTALPALAVIVVLVVTPAFPTADAGTYRIGSVQGNGPAGYFDDREPYGVFRAQLEATEAIIDEPMDLLVWPEGGIDADPLANASVARALDRLSERVEAPLLVNAATTRGENSFNTSMLWRAGADNPVAIHDKSRPVPMGEYVPDRWFFEMIVPDLIGLIQREYTPGTNPPFIDVDGVGLGLAICFDVLYDDVIWAGAREGAQVYVFQTNNADFRDTDENLQQLAFARMRAIETGRSVVNISTVGTSQVIAPDGKELDGLPAAEAGAMITDVPLRTGLTPAVVLGGAVQVVLGWGSAAALVVIGLIAGIKRRR
ncbi:apolipoprotein N-acyltransferase [Microbacterium imperiale]|uniref:Apolipoprotein N-acyltransferase n=1 Tax=Microbacterium imperiale TaxID=33884 RepID=A0A9W6M2T1_9MICO|nr:apolipoprotein N-acyltransferase [Microbacterium imperiale]MBP2419406.1 apolipoprotein N-acyltransferase [Microbacterium imperiale]MDS0198724.1 apolipoprotein N-acyltransferase [Microbacterium imperiale]BFE39748.1 apolipoprotein N-acyltransferase [Microbacterium imperiale]GLJ79276.1 apolipoprotein N-acyltransferase [Microbacterium imperiale]